MESAVFEQPSESQQREFNSSEFGAAPKCTRRVIELVVCSMLGVSDNDLRARTRKTAPVALARQIAMYLAHVVYGLSLKQAAALFNRDRTTAAHACCIVEDRRDDPAFDRLMDKLERALIVLRPRNNAADFG